MAKSMGLHALGCRDQTLQHTKPNHRYKLGENAFQDIKAGCGWILLHAHLTRRSSSFLPSAESGAEGGRSGASCSATLGCPCPCLRNSLLFWLGRHADSIPWSPCPLISLAKAVHCIWSDCNFWIVVAWANQTQFPAIQSPALLPNESYFPAKLHLSNHSQFCCRAAKKKRSERFKKKKNLLLPYSKASLLILLKLSKQGKKSLWGRCWL